MLEVATDATDVASDEVLCERQGSIALVTLNRPSARNAFNVSMTAAFLRTLEELDDDPEVRAIVVTGAGKYFSAGAELTDVEIFADKDNHRDEWRINPRDGRRWPWEMDTPIIAAINGSAVGMGLTLALQWDIRFMAEDAKYGFVFTRRGVIPELNSTWLLPKVAGLSNAADLLLSGRHFDGREAERMGIANRSLPRADVLTYALSYATELAEKTTPRGVAVAKRNLYEYLDMGCDASHQAEYDKFEALGRTPDAVEGVESFLEKRTPRWVSTKRGTP